MQYPNTQADQPAHDSVLQQILHGNDEILSRLHCLHVRLVTTVDILVGPRSELDQVKECEPEGYGALMEIRRQHGRIFTALRDLDEQLDRLNGVV